MLSLAIIGGILILVGYATTVAWGPAKMASYATLPFPLMNLVHTTLHSSWTPWFWILTVLIINSTVTAIIAITNAQVRVLYALGRDRIGVPASLGTTHPRHKTPARAIHVQSIMGMAVVTIIGFWLGSFAGFLFLAELVTLSNLIIHIMANISLIRYYRQTGGFRVVVHGIIPIVASLMFLFPIYFSLFPVPNFPNNIPPYLLLIWLGIGTVLLMRIMRKTPERIRGAGMITAEQSTTIVPPGV